METSAKPCLSKKENAIWKLWNYRRNLTIEVVAIFWLLPLALQGESVSNLALEKACLFQAEQDPIICKNFLDKSINEINCEDLPDYEDYSDFNENSMMPVFMDMHVPVVYELGTAVFNETVCKAEHDAEIVVAIFNVIRVPIATVITIIVIHFAGGWSDRNGLRKPCMIFPLIGEVLTAVAFLIASIFMDQISMEFNTFVEKILPAIFGGSSLMNMGIYSYLTAATPKENRVFRFGIYSGCSQIVSFIGSKISGMLYRTVGYITVFIISIVLFGCGILYIIYFVKEIKPSKTSEDINEHHDNPAFESTDNENRTVRTKIEELKMKPEEIPVKKRPCLVKYFYPTRACNCFQLFMTKRPIHYRLYLILIVIIYPLCVQPQLTEAEYTDTFVSRQLSEDSKDYSHYKTISNAVIVLGTAVMIGVFSKILKMSNSMVGIVSILGTIIARPIYAFSPLSAIFYLAMVLDLFVGTREVAVKSIVSTIVEQEELGRVYSAMGITDAIVGYGFPFVYRYLDMYTMILEDFTRAVFIFGEVFFIPVLILLAIIFFKVERVKKSEEDKSEDKEKANCNNNEYESTHL